MLMVVDETLRGRSRSAILYAKTLVEGFASWLGLGR